MQWEGEEGSVDPKQRRDLFCEKGVVKNLPKFTGKTCASVSDTSVFLLILQNF